MIISPITLKDGAFKANKNSLNNEGEYKDPLMRWPLRGAAFTNEVGEALRPVIGSYATLSWAPALLYIGADVYDKYKNNKVEYSPDSKRCLKQAIFQGMASIFLPLVAVKTGQNIFAQIGKLSDNKISFSTQEHVSRIAKQFIANGKMAAFDGQDEACIEEFTNNVANSFDYKHKRTSLKNLLNIFKTENNEQIEKYSVKTIKDLIELRQKLLNPPEEFKSSKHYKAFQADIKKGQTPSVAVKSVLSQFQQNKMLQGKFVKTIGGFIALGLAIKPIDHFVEKTLIGKYVGPQIDNFNYDENGRLYWGETQKK